MSGGHEGKAAGDKHMHDAGLTNAGGSASPSGLLLIDKHIGPTSMHVCANVRARLRRGGAPKRVKVGHAGTLDPMATGLLVILVGSCTKLCDSLMASRKGYEATIDLAHTSDSDDAEGRVSQAVLKGPIPTREAVELALATMVGSVMQVPPMVSALHVGGERAYDMARAGRGVLLPARAVTIHSIELVEFGWPFARIRVACGKGVYIRSIARDLGALVGAGGMLTQLRRTFAEPFDVANARTLASVPEVLTQAELMTPPGRAS